MSGRDFSPSSRRQESADRLGRTEGAQTSADRYSDSPGDHYDHQFSLSEQDSRRKPNGGPTWHGGIKIMLAVLSLESSLLRMQLERAQKANVWAAIVKQVSSDVGEYGKENFDRVAKELLYYREKTQELTLELSKLKQKTQTPSTAVAPLAPRVGGSNSVLDRLHKVQIEKDVSNAAKGPWIYDQKFTDVRVRTLLVHSLGLWLDHSRKSNAGSTQLGMLASLAFSKWYLMSRFKISAEEGDPGPSQGVFRRVWDRFRKELRVKKVYPSIDLPKNKYQLEREAFDYERLVQHRRRFRHLMRSIFRNQNRRFKLMLVIGYFKLIANSGLLAMKDRRELVHQMQNNNYEDEVPASPSMRRRTVSVSPKLLFGPLQDKRREKLYSISSREFPYNIAQSKNANMPGVPKGWNGESDVAESQDQRKERAAMLEANRQTRSKLVRQASEARVGLVRKYHARGTDWGT